MPRVIQGLATDETASNREANAIRRAVEEGLHAGSHGGVCAGKALRRMLTYVDISSDSKPY